MDGFLFWPPFLLVVGLLWAVVLGTFGLVALPVLVVGTLAFAFGVILAN